jgi:hypothetical protein
LPQERFQGVVEGAGTQTEASRLYSVRKSELRVLQPGRLELTSQSTGERVHRLKTPVNYRGFFATQQKANWCPERKPCVARRET